MFLILRLHNHIVLGVFVVLIGLSGIYTIVTLDRRRLDDFRYMRGPGFMIGLLVSKTSVQVARCIWSLMCLAICALGVANIVR